MELWLWIVCGVCVVIIILLCVKLYLMRKSALEIDMAFAERLITDTNTLITISSRDRCMRALANNINRQLRVYRRERSRFQQGDRELKEAVTNMSHDLRTPLTAICGYLELLLQEEAPENTRRYLSLIENRTEHLKQLTEELFRYSMAASEKEEVKQRLVLNHVLEESLLSYYAAMEKRRITPAISIPEQRVERLLNRSALLRVFGNIIGNALKYSDGDLEVSMENTGRIVFSNTAKNLTPIMAGRLFDRFYTVEAGKNSTGLGLSIAKLLTQRMGGTITAEYRGQKLYVILCFPDAR